MKHLLAATVLTLVLAGVSSPADAKRYPPGYWEQRDRDLQNRREARRAGLAAAVITTGVSRAVQNDRIERRYSECVMATGYDRVCDQRRFDEQLLARQRSRRRGVVAGIATHAAVRR
jgi:hypothetical protein